LAGCGRCVSPEAPEQIAQALLQIKDSPSEARNMAARGRSFAEDHFSKKMILAGYEKLLT